VSAVLRFKDQLSLSGLQSGKLALGIGGKRLVCHEDAYVLIVGVFGKKAIANLTFSSFVKTNLAKISLNPRYRNRGRGRSRRFLQRLRRLGLRGSGRRGRIGGRSRRAATRLGARKEHTAHEKKKDGQQNFFH
jgi:hypothetical protein